MEAQRNGTPSGAPRIQNAEIYTGRWSDSVALIRPQRTPDEVAMSDPLVLRIDNVSADTTEKELTEALSPYGEVKSVELHKGYALVSLAGNSTRLPRSISLRAVAAGHNPMGIRIQR